MCIVTSGYLSSGMESPLLKLDYIFILLRWFQFSEFFEIFSTCYDTRRFIFIVFIGFLSNFGLILIFSYRTLVKIFVYFLFVQTTYYEHNVRIFIYLFTLDFLIKLKKKKNNK